MEISYYTINDLRLPPKRALRKGWTMERFPTLNEALDRYRVLPPSGVKSLGLTDGAHVLEVVRCLPLFPYDREGENVLAPDHRQFPLWASSPEAENAAERCITELGPRYTLMGKMIVPIPPANELSAELQGSYLWLNLTGELQSAIRKVYAAGTGWISPTAVNRFPSPPLVLKYQVDGITEQGAYRTLEVEPWEYDLLAAQTMKRLKKDRSSER